MEEVLGHPQDKRQHVYVSRWWKDQWVIHEEILEIKETKKVERAAKRLVMEVQVSFASPDRWDCCKQYGPNGGGGPLAPAT